MITTANRNKIWQLYTGKIKNIAGTGKCYLGFSTTTPTASGSNFSEPSKATNPSYARVQLNINDAMEYTDKFGTVSEGAVSNSKEITTPECKEEAGWGTFTHFGIFDVETGGTPLAFDLLTDPDGEPDEDGRYPAKPLTIEVNHVGVFRIGTLQLKLT